MRVSQKILLGIALLFNTTLFASDFVSLSLPSLVGLQLHANQTYYNVELRVTNTTPGPMYLNYLFDTIYPSGFTVNSSNCSNTRMNQGGYCSIFGTYTPTATGKNTWSTKIAAESIRWNPIYSISTTVSAAQLLLAPDSPSKLAAFTSEAISESIMIFNPGPGVITNLSASISTVTNGTISMSSDACGSIVGANTMDPCNIQYTAAATDSGTGVNTQVATITITYDDSAGNPQTFTTKLPIVHVDRGHFMSMPVDSRAFSGLPSNQIQNVFVSGQSIYLGTPVAAVMSTNGGWRWFNATSLQGLGTNIVNGMTSFTDSEGNTTIYAATTNGLGVSTDGGLTFTNHTTGLVNASVNSVYVDSNGTVYVATQQGLQTCSGVCSTFSSNYLTSTLVYQVVVYHDKIYAATANGLKVSNSVSTPAFESTYITTPVNSVLGNNYVIYASQAAGRALYECTASCDHAGRTFYPITSGVIQGLAADGYSFYVASSEGLAISTDGGTTFPILRTTAEGLGDNNVRSVVVSGGTIYAATNGGLSTSVNGGVRFNTATGVKNLVDTTRTLYVQLDDLTNGPQVYVGSAGYGLNFGNGETFNTVLLGGGTADENTINGIYAYHDNHTSNQIVYVATNAGLQKSTHSGGDFSLVSSVPAGHVNAVSGVVGAGGTPIAIYAATNNGLYYSTDGSTFNLVSDIFLGTAAVHSVSAMNFLGVGLGALIGTAPLSTGHYSLQKYAGTGPALVSFTLTPSAPYPTIYGNYMSADSSTIYAYDANNHLYYSGNSGTSFSDIDLSSAAGDIQNMFIYGSPVGLRTKLVPPMYTVYLATRSGVLVCATDCTTISQTYTTANGLSGNMVYAVNTYIPSATVQAPAQPQTIYALLAGELYMTQIPQG